MSSQRIYSIKECYYTLQGEGANTGRAAVFCRFAGCNLWSGRERDRTDAVCNFCDTEFVGTDGDGGGTFDSVQLSEHIANTWPGSGNPFVVCTGGEPLLQLDDVLIAALHKRGMEIAVETNGTIASPEGIDWLTVSPKSKARLVQTSGDELKLVFPQIGAEPSKYKDLDFVHFFLQPMDGPRLAENTHLATAYCLKHPVWRISLQTHKLIGLR